MTPVVYLDSNVFITAFETIGALSDHAWRVLDASERGTISCVTSELTLAELLSHPPSDNPELIDRYRHIISDRKGLAVAIVDRPTLIEAARLRQTAPGMKLPDAIHLATALLRGCSHFVTDDRRIRSVGTLRMIGLSPHNLDEIGSLA